IGERESLSRKPEACVICRRRVVHDPCDPPPIEVRLTMAHHVRRRTAAALAVICATSLAAAPAAAADGPDAAALMAAVEDHCGENGCHDILPPGQNGNATLVDILGNQLFGTRPAHSSGQLDMYDDLLHDYQGLDDAGLDSYF